jgi:acyl carrier protein
MTRSEIEATVKYILVEQLAVGEDEIHDDSTIINDLGADSIDIVELILAMEHEFDFEVADDDADKLLVVGDVYKYIESKLAE